MKQLERNAITLRIGGSRCRSSGRKAEYEEEKFQGREEGNVAATARKEASCRKVQMARRAYDDVREKTVDWIEYHDEYGKAYYYDPVLKTYSYDCPMMRISTITQSTTGEITMRYMARELTMSISGMLR